MRARFDEPIERASKLTRRTLSWFPVRVWRHFLQHNGFLLAAGISYQALFAAFAAVYLAFAIAGLWLGGSPDAIQAMIDVIDFYLPGLISDDGTGVFTTEQVTEIATSSAGVLGVTGLIALVTVVWTAIGFVTFARRAVRDIFGLEPDRRSYVLLKARDLLAAIIFGAALIGGSALNYAGTWAISAVFRLFGWDTSSVLYQVGGFAASVIISFSIFTTALAALFRFLTGTELQWRRIWPGALLGGGAITILQLGAGLLLSYTPTNPLLATFAIFVGLLLWFRIMGIIILVAASWTAVRARDVNEPLLPESETDRLAAEHRALLIAARVRLRTAEEVRDQAPWFRVWMADRAVREAQRELAEVEASAPASRKERRGSLLE
nr:YihY/virulence factor BrkB family protein [Microbacterium immunditiarum]